MHVIETYSFTQLLVLKVQEVTSLATRSSSLLTSAIVTWSTIYARCQYCSAFMDTALPLTCF